jgi:hypothetical protein
MGYGTRPIHAQEQPAPGLAVLQLAPMFIIARGSSLPLTCAQANSASRPASPHPPARIMLMHSLIPSEPEKSIRHIHAHAHPCPSEGPYAIVHIPTWGPALVNAWAQLAAPCSEYSSYVITYTA